MIPSHLPQSPSASTPDNLNYKEEPKLDCCSYRQRPWPGGNLAPGIFLIFYQTSSRKFQDLSTLEPSGCSILCHLGAKTAGEVDKNLHGRAEQGRTKISAHKPKVKQGDMGFLYLLFKVHKVPLNTLQVASY